MASIIKASINLNEIPKHKIIDGKKGKYLPITITINDEVDQFGNQGPIMVEQSKEERESKAAKVYLGNVKVVWTNGTNVEAAPRTDGQSAPSPQRAPQGVSLLSPQILSSLTIPYHPSPPHNDYTHYIIYTIFHALSIPILTVLNILITPYNEYRESCSWKIAAHCGEGYIFTTPPVPHQGNPCTPPYAWVWLWYG
jgi:hypothetical protein